MGAAWWWASQRWASQRWAQQRWVARRRVARRRVARRRAVGEPRVAIPGEEGIVRGIVWLMRWIQGFSEGVDSAVVENYRRK